MIGYIYYILDLTNADMYIGSCSKDRWYKRKLIHKDLEYNTCSSKQIIENNNYIFEILEENEFIDKNDLHKKEQFYIDNNKCINKNRAYVSEEQTKEYYENNKEEIKNKSQKYYQDNKHNEEFLKKLRINNKNYREKNKEKIRKIKNEKINCDICNSLVNKGNISTHKKTKKCMSYLIKQQQ